MQRKRKPSANSKIKEDNLHHALGAPPTMVKVSYTLNADVLGLKHYPLAVPLDKLLVAAYVEASSVVEETSHRYFQC